jgi:outer membrane protein assembly factor BamE (lipoprotein component of BamABCDE complex)
MIPASLHMKNRLPAILAAAALGLAAQACTPNVDMRGNLPHADLLSQVAVGKSTRDDVLVLLGSPSTVNSYGEETWNYISSRTESVAFFAPETKERKVITVVFNRAGVVKDMSTKGLEDGKELQVVERETPSAGKELNLLQQMVGNVGRFSKEGSGGGMGGHGGPMPTGR